MASGDKTTLEKAVAVIRFLEGLNIPATESGQAAGTSGSASTSRPAAGI